MKVFRDTTTVKPAESVAGWFCEQKNKKCTFVLLLPGLLSGWKNILKLL